MKFDHDFDKIIERSYFTRNIDFIKNYDAKKLNLKNVNDDIRIKTTHIENLNLKIIKTIQLMNYDIWKDKSTCLIILQFNHREITNASTFRRIEILIFCEFWDFQSLNRQSVLRNFSSRKQFVRLDHNRDIWNWNALQKSCIFNKSISDFVFVNLNQSTFSNFDNAWFNKKRMKLHQISWIIDSENRKQWQISNRLNFAFVVQYYSIFKITIEINAKTRFDFSFLLIALSWSKDDFLFFNDKSQIEHFVYTSSFDQLLNIHWAKLASYLPEWNEVVRSKQIISGESAEQPESHQKMSDRDIKITMILNECIGSTN